MQKVSFVACHYLAIILFIFISWSLGVATSYLAKNRLLKYGAIENSLLTALGFGIIICTLQLIAISGNLKLNSLLYLLCFFLLLGICIARVRLIEVAHNLRLAFSSYSKVEKTALLLLLLFLLPIALQPLRPPRGWDALMYHLPHAKQWAYSGLLTVNQNLRYPWFPYNVELLYAACLVMLDDVLPQMLHAACGWIIAYLIFHLGKRYYNFFVAMLAVIIWFNLPANDHGTGLHYANVDMFLSLFIFSAFITFFLWLENRKKNYWLVICSFFIGLSVGTKYQALMYIPLFAFTLLIFERNYKKLFIIILIFLIPCIYWYARNSIYTGNPINPMGAKIFGFYDWNMADYKAQFEDLKNHKGWPIWFLWFAPLSLFISNCKNALFNKSILIFCAYSFLVWLVISQYPRYLLPATPLISILAADGIYILIFNISNIPKAFIDFLRPYKKIGLMMLVMVVLIQSLIETVSTWKKIAFDLPTREAMLIKKSDDYKAVFYLNNNLNGKTYQFGFLDKLYYFTNETWGDGFGPGRHSDFMLTPSKLSEKLTQQGFKVLAIQTELAPTVNQHSDFSCYFKQVYHSETASIYTINSTNECD